MKKYLLIFCLAAVGTQLSCGGDSADDPKVNCNSSDLSVQLIGTTDAGCDTDGLIEVMATGGSGAVLFSVNDSSFQSSGVFNVSAGNYTVTAKDNAGCTATVQATVLAEEGSITIESVTATDAGCGTDNATVTVTASGAGGELMYTLNSGTPQVSNQFSGLGAGNYTVTVDDGECSAQRSVKVLAGTSLVDDIMPLLQLNCVKSTCHNGDNGADKNWTVKENVLAKASLIKSRTQSGAMPPAGSGESLTDEEKDLIACWVDDGALDN